MRLKPFKDQVLSVVSRIPSGQVLTYKQVAIRAGRPQAFRAVGNILNRHGGMDKGIPCHRVIKSSGEIGGFAWGTKKKIKMLKAEGYSSGYKNTRLH